MPEKLLNQFIRTNPSFGTAVIRPRRLNPVGPTAFLFKVQPRPRKGKLGVKQRDRETYPASREIQNCNILRTDCHPASAILRIDDSSLVQPLHQHTVSEVGDKTPGLKPLRGLSFYRTRQTLSKFHKRHSSTQPEVGNMEDLTSSTDRVSIKDPSSTTEASKPQVADDITSAPSIQTQNQSQPQQKKEKKAKAPKQPSTPTTLPLSPALIDLRVGHILRCIPHENADSLYVSTIAMGDTEGTDNTHKDEETGRVVRTVCSGLRGLIPIEQMQDRKVIVMANLKPVTMRGIKSAAMVLAASPPPKEGEDPHAADRVVELVAPPEGSEGGARVYFEGWEYGEGKGPEKVLNPKKKQWESVQPGLYTSEDLTVVFDAARVQGIEGGAGKLVVEGVEGKCKVPSLKGARLS